MNYKWQKVTIKEIWKKKVMNDIMNNIVNDKKESQCCERQLYS